MNSTIEVVWLVNAVLYFCSCWLACVLNSTLFDARKGILVSMGISFALMVFYRVDGLFMVIELAVGSFFFAGKWENLLQIILCHLFFVVLGWKIAGGKSAGLVLFVPSYSVRWIGMLHVVVGLTFVLVIVIQWIKKKKRYAQVKLRFNEKECWVSGFLDSGNLLRYKNIPVIFVSKSYYPYCASLKCDSIIYTTVGSKEETCVYLIEAEINRQWKQVYAAFSSELKGSMECLLNEGLFD